MSSWPNLSDLLMDGGTPSPICLIGAPLAAGSVTPGACDEAPQALRQAVKRIGRYDVEIGRELFTPIADTGDLDLKDLTIEDATPVIQQAVANCCASHSLTLLLGGNNAVTRPGLKGLGLPLGEVGLITLDAHFDMRDTSEGLSNGNPVRALLQDGLPGANIAQVGIASFANTVVMHRDAIAAGNMVVTMGDIRREGIRPAIARALGHVSHCKALVIDCDIDVIDRSQMPGAPGARPGGMHVSDFFWAVRTLAMDYRTRLIDLTEWDPSLDSSDLSSLTAGRWLAECIAGFELR
jgi:arginase family enzyme